MKNRIIASSAFVFAGLLASFALVAQVYAAGGSITSSLDIGSSGANVTTLQVLLASNPAIYPEGLTTGYYGALTAKAVTQFQIAYGLPPVGRVGPLTLAKLNGILAMPVPNIDIAAPTMSASTVAQSSTNATLNWNTGESARGSIFFAPTPLSEQEATPPMTPPMISGSMAQEASFGTSHSLTLNALSPASTYYYVIQSVDAAGNVSVTVPAVFATTP